MKTDILTKYKMALVKAENTPKLECHVFMIKEMIKTIEAHGELLVLDEVWVNYFLQE